MTARRCQKCDNTKEDHIRVLFSEYGGTVSIRSAPGFGGTQTGFSLTTRLATGELVGHPFKGVKVVRYTDRSGKTCPIHFYELSDGRGWVSEWNPNQQGTFSSRVSKSGPVGDVNPGADLYERTCGAQAESTEDPSWVDWHLFSDRIRVVSKKKFKHVQKAERSNRMLVQQQAMENAGRCAAVVRFCGTHGVADGHYKLESTPYMGKPQFQQSEDPNIWLICHRGAWCVAYAGVKNGDCAQSDLLAMSVDPFSNPACPGSHPGHARYWVVRAQGKGAPSNGAFVIAYTPDQWVSYLRQVEASSLAAAAPKVILPRESERLIDNFQPTQLVPLPIQTRTLQSSNFKKFYSNGESLERVGTVLGFLNTLKAFLDVYSARQG